jgi:hypothetical protein
MDEVLTTRSIRIIAGTSAQLLPDPTLPRCDYDMCHRSGLTSSHKRDAAGMIVVGCEAA